MAGTIQSAINQAVKSVDVLATGVKAVRTIEEAKEQEELRWARTKEMMEAKMKYGLARIRAETRLEAQRTESLLQKQKIAKALAKGKEAQTEGLLAKERMGVAKEEKKVSDIASIEAKTKLVEARTARTEALMKRSDQIDARRKKHGK